MAWWQNARRRIGQYLHSRMGKPSESASCSCSLPPLSEQRESGLASIQLRLMHAFGLHLGDVSRFSYGDVSAISLLAFLMFMRMQRGSTRNTSVSLRGHALSQLSFFLLCLQLQPAYGVAQSLFLLPQLHDLDIFKRCAACSCSLASCATCRAFSTL